MCKNLKHNGLSYFTSRRNQIKKCPSRISNCPIGFQIVLVEIPIINIILSLNGDFNLS